MAAQVRDHPQSRLHRSAFAHAAAEVIRTHGDAPVLRAIELAPDLKIARAIRQAAEAACETVSTSSNGRERQARLFSIAIVVRFAEPLTEREFGDYLAPILDTGSLLARAQECGGHHRARSFIWPHAWAFDDLSRLSLSDVRQLTIMASTAGAAANGNITLRFPPIASAQRRCATFLRYLMGYQIGSEAMLERNQRLRFANCVRGVVRVSLSDAQDIAVIYDGCFYRSLWHGLRVYQRYRLADVVAALAAQGIGAHELAASVAFTGNRNQMSARVVFLRSGKKLDHHVYRVLFEPQTDPTTTMAWIVAPLRSLGVNVNVAREGATLSTADRPELERNTRAERRFATLELTLPL